MLSLLLFLVLCVSAHANVCLGPSHNLDPSTFESIEAKFESLGFTFQEGGFSWCGTLMNTKCGEDENVGCHYDNPSSPYGFVWIPPAPDEDVEANSKYVIPDLSFTDLERSQWRLRSDEVVVIAGCSPPPLKFFSFQHYLMDHWNRWRGDFDHIAGSLGKTVNILTINTQTGKSFDSPFAITMSSNQNAVKLIQTGLKEFIGNGANNTLTLPNRLYEPPKEGWFRDSILNYGVQPKADTFLLIMRTAFSISELASKWTTEPINFKVYRLTPKTPVSEIKPYPAPVIEHVNVVEHSELQYQDAFKFLREQVLRTATAVFQTFDTGSNGPKPTERPILTTQPFYDTKYGYSPEPYQGWGVLPSVTTLTRTDLLIEWAGDCLYGFGIPWIRALSHSNCQLDTRDTTYMSSAPSLSLQYPGDFIYMMGGNHVATGASTYSNNVFYNAWIRTAVLTVDDEQFAGSADEFLVGTPYQHVSKYLYVIRIAREGECLPKEKWCFEVPLSQNIWKHRPPGSKVVHAERAYLNSISLEGPDDKHMLEPMYYFFRVNRTQPLLEKEIEANRLGGAIYYVVEARKLFFTFISKETFIKYGYKKIIWMFLGVTGLILFILISILKRILKTMCQRSSPKDKAKKDQ